MFGPVERQYPEYVKMQLSKKREERIANPTAIVLVLAASFLLYFVGLGSFGVTDPGEGYYVEAAREMVESGDFITPHLNYQIYFSKPILTFWIMAGSYLCLGVNEIAARLPFAILATLLFLATYFVGKSIGGNRCGLIAALIAATSPLMMAFVKLSPIDIAFAFFLDLAVFAFALTCLLQKTKCWPLVWIALALAVLTKGPAGIVLFSLGVILFLIVERASFTVNLSRLKLLHPFLGIAIFLILTVPWYVAVSDATKGLFLKVFFLYENYARFSGHTNLAHTAWYHYFIVLLYGFFPWIVLLIPALQNAVSGPLSFVPSRKALLFLTIWAGAFFAFFSFSKTQLDTYMLPLLAPLSVVVGAFVEGALTTGMRTTRYSTWLKAFCLILIVVFLIGLPLFLVVIAFKGNVVFPFPERFMLVVFAIAGGGLSVWFLVNRHTDRTFATLVCTFVCIASVAIVNGFQYADIIGQKPLRDMCIAFRDQPLKFAMFRGFKPSMMFYLRKPVDSFFHESQIVANGVPGPHRRRLSNLPEVIIVHQNALPLLAAPSGVQLKLKEHHRGWYLFELEGGRVDSVEELQAMFKDPDTFKRAISGQSDWGPLTVPYGAGNPDVHWRQRDGWRKN
jgi:4-amino-4-deoxy-L-arabinose transferase-like glycosyltransferase